MSSLNLLVEAVIPNAVVFKDGASGRGPHDGISAFIRRHFPLEDIARKWLTENQEEGSYQNSTILAS